MHWFFRKELGPAMLGIALLEGRKGGLAREILDEKMHQKWYLSL